MKRKTWAKWVVAMAAVVLATVCLAGCSWDTLRIQSGGTGSINVNYRLELSDENKTLGSDTDVAQNVAALMMPAVLTIECSNNNQGSAGTGFVVDPAGYVVTNAHVVTYEVTSGGGFFPSVTKTYLYPKINARYCDSNVDFPMDVVAYDTSLDLAVLKFQNPPENLVANDGVAEGDTVQYSGQQTVVAFADSDGLKYGQFSVAIGNASGLGLAVTTGVVSAPEREFDNGDLTTTKAIQTDTAINPGNSGGPLFDKWGRVIGVNSFKFVDDDIENLGYAIPSNVVMHYLDTVGQSEGITFHYRCI